MKTKKLEQAKNELKKIDEQILNRVSAGAGNVPTLMRPASLTVGFLGSEAKNPF